MGYPETSEDTVVYGERNFYVDSDTFVGMLDGSTLDIWGSVTVNGAPIGDSIINGGGVAAIQALTQSDYDALSPPNPSTLYIIVPEEDLPVGGIDTVVSMTQAVYDALSTPDPTTLYVIVAA